MTTAAPLPRASAKASVRRPRVVVAVWLTIMTSGCAVTAAPAPGGPAPSQVAQRIAVYGDSLTAESRSVLIARLGGVLRGWEVDVNSFGGTAQCDWHDEMRRDARELRPDVVLIAFSGNQLTSCAIGREYPELYREDAEWAVHHWSRRGAELVFVGAPPAVGDAELDVPDVYKEVAELTGTRFVSADRLFVDPVSGTAESLLACATVELAAPSCEDGAVQVRSPDGFHLCPVSVVFASCTADSSGVRRYAATIVEGAAQAAGVPFTVFPDARSAPGPSAIPDPAAT